MKCLLIEFNWEFSDDAAYRAFRAVYKYPTRPPRTSYYFVANDDYVYSSRAHKISRLMSNPWIVTDIVGDDEYEYNIEKTFEQIMVYTIKVMEIEL